MMPMTIARDDLRCARELFMMHDDFDMMVFAFVLHNMIRPEFNYMEALCFIYSFIHSLI